MLTMSITGDKQVERQLMSTIKAMPRQIDAGLVEVGRLVQSGAKERAPHKFGNLTNAIVLIKKRGEVLVGVFRGVADRYAHIIHNLQEVKWHKLGPQNKAKQGRVKVGGKFLTRSYDEQEDDLQKKFEAEITKALP